MARPRLFNIKVECNLCNFYVEIKSIEKYIVNTTNNLIKYHNEYSPNCNAKKDDFSINFITKDNPIDKTRDFVETKLNETEKLLKEKNYHLSDFIGNDDVKDVIRSRLVNYIVHKDRLRKIRKYPISGLILAGIQGTGKSEILCASINDILLSNEEYKKRFNVIIMRCHDFMAGIVGESGSRIESILGSIRELNRRENKEAILIIDEIDNLTPDRNTRSVLTSERTGSMLDEFGGMHDDHTIFLMGTTNKPDRIDSEALVSGRFGNPILVNIPNEEDRYKLFLKFTSDMNVSKDVDSKFINDYFGRFTGRDLFYFTNNLQIIYYNKETLSKYGDRNPTYTITKSDIIDLVTTSNFKNTNLHNLESIKKLSIYYSRFNETVRGDDTTIERTTRVSSDEIEQHFKDLITGE